jgi:hypothetical protein
MATPLRGQQRKSALSDAETEQIRNARYVPADCILLYAKFLDERTKEIQDLYAKPRRPGREEDTRELMDQVTSIADELSDNLDDYGPRHMDLRKALPKVVDATERWASAVRTPPEDGTYSVVRKLALESIRDLREAATQMVPEQAAWFKAHPPAKQQDGLAPPIDIPR